MTALYERYAPATLAEVVGQDAAVKVIRNLAQRDALTQRAYWISGIDAAPLSVYSDLYYRTDGNMLAMLQAVETGEI